MNCALVLLLAVSRAAAVVEYVALTPVAGGPAAGNASGIVKWARLEYSRSATAVGDVAVELLESGDDEHLGAWFDLDLTRVSGGATDGAALDALTAALDACAARVAAGGGDGVDAVAESITTASVVLHRAVAPACVVLLSLDEGDGGKKAKGKKKKKGGGDATPARAALDGALAALAALLRAARTALRALLSAADDGPPALPPPLLAGLDDGALAEALRSSRKISLDRLLEVASAKLAALQAAGVK